MFNQFKVTNVKTKLSKIIDLTKFSIQEITEIQAFYANHSLFDIEYINAWK